jgi:hypothetical protein
MGRYNSIFVPLAKGGYCNTMGLIKFHREVSNMITGNPRNVDIKTIYIIALPALSTNSN